MSFHIRIVKKNQISCTGVHGILIFLQIHVPRYMKFDFFFHYSYVKTHGGGWPGILFFGIFGIFFQHVKIFLNFLNFVKIKMAKFKLNQMG